MTRIALAIVLMLFATAAQAQAFFTLRAGEAAWWMRASFNPMHTEVRGIPVKSIRPNWCKATEFTHELMKDLLAQEEAGQTMKQIGFTFAIEGYFDRSKVKQVALVGVYQECGGTKGTFLLIIDEGTKKVRFVDATPTEEQFAAVRAYKNDIVMTPCLECDGAETLRWNAKKKAFTWGR